jgi:hypothetical protein
MLKTKGKPAREAQRRLTGEEIGSWTALQTKIEGGFSGTITLAANFDCNYNSEIDIVKHQDVTIHANGAVCNAQQGGRFFDVIAGATLTLNGMTLKNGSASTVSVFALCFCGWPFVTLLQHTPSCNTPFPQPPCAMLLQTLLQHHVEHSTETREGPSTTVEHTTSKSEPLRAAVQAL